MFKEKMFNAVLADEVAQIPDDITEEPGMEQAFAEMYQILKHCDQEITSCIPEKFMQMLKKCRDPDWSGELDFSKSLSNMELLDKTMNLIHLVYRDFLCSESERKELIEEGRRVAAENGDIDSMLTRLEESTDDDSADDTEDSEEAPEVNFDLFDKKTEEE